ncbi:MAG: hypothetical protein AAFQ94_27880 [Bacteroidota bacterium]
MESIETLLDKYWKGDTTLEEEKIIKEYFRKKSENSKSPDIHKGDLTPYFGEIQRRSEMTYQGKVPGFKISFNRNWVSLAATVVIGIMAGFMTLQQNVTKDPYLVEDPEKALQIMKSTFQMISNNLDEGKKYSSEINKINKTRQILETN